MKNWHIFVQNRHTTPVTKKDISDQEVTNMSNNYEQNKYNNSYDESGNSKNSQNSQNSQNKQNSQNQNKNQSNNKEQNKSC